ncbi:cysteine dioxygenase family protein [Roseococcus suduntuyensis]|uniref:Putative metal-dependent enzyme (Double-stranded beta helix superfamily) n=1 Tax=Roseococcus suduntuyensis TaxID=455361 RepID=A0A840AFN0_9PROT|nr:cysteine dioxygenase family protein [Roseococcus suduntuyensis]MBB3899004.1 putative metal-dependent enzyme (double-stranded beta helix superfamily) [Roseococcus suduntuyensis]
MNVIFPLEISPLDTALDRMLADVAAAARAPLARRHLAVAEALAPHMQDPRLLSGRDCPCNPERYVRHLLHADPAGEYAVVALVWRPGQMSPVHAHRTWCALGVHQGVLSEHYYVPGAPPRLDAVHLRRAGDVSHGPADPDLIHRLANCSAEVAVSIHVYGVPFEDFGDKVNLILG